MNLKIHFLTQKMFHLLHRMHSRCFGIMGGHRNFTFNLAVKVSVELGYTFRSLRL
jgi:hypothetical protein